MSDQNNRQPEVPLEELGFQAFRIFEIKKLYRSLGEARQVIFDYVPLFELLLLQGTIVGYHFLHHNADLDLRICVTEENLQAVQEQFRGEVTRLLPNLEDASVDIYGGTIGGYVHYAALFALSRLTYQMLLTEHRLGNDFDGPDKDKIMAKVQGFLPHFIHYFANMNGHSYESESKLYASMSSGYRELVEKLKGDS